MLPESVLKTTPLINRFCIHSCAAHTSPPTSAKKAYRVYNAAQANLCTAAILNEIYSLTLDVAPQTTGRPRK